MNKHSNLIDTAKKKKVIYVAGPITDISRKRVWDNCVSGTQWAYMCMLAGASVHCPHTFYLAGLQDIMTWEDYLERDIAIMLRCDALLLTGAWQGSEGCRLEKLAAEQHGIPVFTTMGQVRDFCKEDES